MKNFFIALAIFAAIFSAWFWIGIATKSITISNYEKPDYRYVTGCYDMANGLMVDIKLCN